MKYANAAQTNPLLIVLPVWLEGGMWEEFSASAQGSQKRNVCCLLPTVMCPVKAKRGLPSIERSTWHIWSTCWHQLLFKGAVNSSPFFYPILHSETQQGAFGRPWNKAARAVILFRMRLLLPLSPVLLPPFPPLLSCLQVWPSKKSTLLRLGQAMAKAWKVQGSVMSWI